jgi:hypothetical protein
MLTWPALQSVHILKMMMMKYLPFRNGSSEWEDRFQGVHGSGFNCVESLLHSLKGVCWDLRLMRVGEADVMGPSVGHGLLVVKFLINVFFMCLPHKFII